MDWLTASVWLFAFGYTILMGIYAIGWAIQKKIPSEGNPVPTTPFSILIPCRNEATQIEDCLNSLLRLNYPSALMEVLVIDDGSEDGTATIVSNWTQGNKPSFPIKIVSNLGTKGKKQALTLGISQASNTYIACTDADCMVPTHWLSMINLVYQKQPEIQVVAGPVLFHREKGLLQWFQSLDLMGLMGITGAGIRLGWQHMANGANLSYKKNAFIAVGGYHDNSSIPSGDDFFLVQKIAAKWPRSIFFLNSPAAAVHTTPMPNWRSFFFQRLRWGSKNAALPEWPVRLSLAWVFLFCWLLLLSLNPLGWIIKALVDFIFLTAMARFWQKRSALWWFLPAQLLHVLYVAIMGVASLFIKKYPWK
jgi:cellulose synthase/poly-beta-1,6-N-acetylglucosamine synthase-like glycosyltransferase